MPTLLLPESKDNQGWQDSLKAMHENLVNRQLTAKPLYWRIRGE